MSTLLNGRTPALVERTQTTVPVLFKVIGTLMDADLFRFNATMRRLSCIPEALSLIPQRAEFRRESTLTESERRASQQEMNTAMQWLERRKSTDSNGGQIDESLYRKRNSVVKIHGSKDSLRIGKAQLKLNYDFGRCDFVLILLEATFDIKLDDYQFVFSLDENQRKESRRISPGCAVNPQTFKFPIPFEDLLNRTLTVELLGTKTSGYGTQRHGVSVMPLFSLSPSDELLIWLELEAVNDKEACGDIQLFLSFLPSAERLTLTIQEAVKLQRLEPNQRDASIYVKASLVLGDKVIKKRKSNIKKLSSLNSIVWNEALSFCGVDPKTLSRCKLEVVVVACSLSNNHYPIGQLTFGPSEGNAGTKESKIWRDMLAGRSTNHLHWLQLHDPSV